MARPQANISGRKFTKEISVSEGKSPEMFESPFHRNIRNPQVATTGIGEVFSGTSQANGAKVVHGRHAVEFDESEVESPAGGANGSAQIGDRNGVTATCPKILLRFAAANPAKLKEMQQLLWTELSKYQVSADGCGGSDADGCSATQRDGR